MNNYTIDNWQLKVKNNSRFSILNYQAVFDILVKKQEQVEQQNSWQLRIDNWQLKNDCPLTIVN